MDDAGTATQPTPAAEADASSTTPTSTPQADPQTGAVAQTDAAPQRETTIQRAAAKQPDAASDDKATVVLPQRSYFTYAFGLAAGALSAYLLVRGIARAGGVLTIVLLAAFLALSLNPIVTALTKQQRVPMRRSGAVLVVALGMLALVAGFLAVIVPPVVTEVTALFHAIPHLLQRIQDRSTYLGRLDARYHVVSRVQSAVSSRGVGSNALTGIVGAGKYVLSTLTSTFAVVALTIYFLAGLPNIVAVAYRTVPASRRARVQQLGDQLIGQVGRYMLGSVLNASIAGLSTYIWTLAWGIEYPAALGVMVALMDMIPVIGSTIGGVIVTLVALTVSAPVAVATLAFYVGFRMFEDYVLLPRVMRQAVDVPPIVTVVALLIGGSLLGIVGALVSIPVAAALKLVIQEVAIPRLDRR